MIWIARSRESFVSHKRNYRRKVYMIFSYTHAQTRRLDEELDYTIK